MTVYDKGVRQNIKIIVKSKYKKLVHTNLIESITMSK